VKTNLDKENYFELPVYGIQLSITVLSLFLNTFNLERMAPN